MRNPIHSEAELRAYDRRQTAQQYAYDLTARLTYFVVSAELVFCGYVLLNASQFGQIKYLNILFLLAGLGAFFGVLWRFFYNQTFHDGAHEKSSIKALQFLQIVVYWLYIALTIVFFTALLWAGFLHLTSIADKENGAQTAAQSELNNSKQPTR